MTTKLYTRSTQLNASQLRKVNKHLRLRNYFTHTVYTGESLPTLEQIGNRLEMTKHCSDKMIDMLCELLNTKI